MARLSGIQKSLSVRHSTFLAKLEVDLLHELNNVMKQERCVWAQKAGLDRAKLRDMNTKYFHTLAKIKKCRKKIVCLKDSDDNWVSDDAVLKGIMTDYFQCIFSSSHDSHARINTFRSVSAVSDDWSERLEAQVSDLEVREALTQMASMKCPGPDGIQAVFYKNFWNQMGPSLLNLVKKAFKERNIPVGLSDSFSAYSQVGPPGEVYGLPPYWSLQYSL